MSKDDYLRRFRPDPLVMPGDAINLTSADLEGLDKPNEELLREVERGPMMDNPDWYAKGVCAGRMLYARLLAGLIPQEDVKKTEQTVMRLIDAGGWPFAAYDIKIIRLTIRGCGFMPGHPLKQDARERNDARAST
jgi:hypothetical protein